MSYEGGYPTVLKKLFPPYWRLLLNKTPTSAIVALVNEWDYNFSTFIFDNMKRLLDDPKKKIFMLYPRFIQMILDERYPSLVKGPNFINLKPMGPGCFDNACRNKRAKHHNFEARFPLEKHGRFADIVQGAPVAPAPSIVPVAPVPPLINAQIAEEHDVQLMQQVQQVADDEEILLVDSDPKQTRLVQMTPDNLAALIRSLQGGDGDPPSISTTDIQETADITEESAPKKQRTDTAPDNTLFGPSTVSESTPTVNP
ncbi:hypothetical protein Hanom_Chr10g00908221 [Helianthus anomalus]